MRMVELEILRCFDVFLKRRRRKRGLMKGVMVF